MFRITWFKVLSIFGVVLLGLLFALPNALPPQVRDALPDFLPKRTVVLGLDLQGGSHLLWEVDRKELTKTLTTQLRGDVRQSLWQENKIRHRLQVRKDGAVIVTITDPAKVEKAAEVLRKLARPVDVGFFATGVQRAEIDVERDGNRFILKFSETGLNARIRRAVEQAIEVIRRRLDELGMTEATIQQQGPERIIVQAPGMRDPSRLKKAIGQTARLTFQLLCDAQPQPGVTSQRPPAGCAAYPDTNNPNTVYWVKTARRATVEGADLVDAQPAFDGQTGEPIVTFRFNQKGALRFGRLTQANVGKPFAIILDNKVVSAPVIQSPILGGTGQISGRFSVEETKLLAVILRSGALPAKLTIVEERSVGPSLGSDSIRAGVTAAIVGLIAVLLFMLVTYGWFGIIADLALLANLGMLIGLLSLFGATLTLPGIAGIVLTLGMAVDSNVLVFERVREEARRGRSVLNALETGFSRAFATILDANITTLIAAVVLYGLGSGPVRGFAVTLGVGIVTTVFTAYTLTRLLVALWVRARRPRALPI
ncbi:MAG TPA: protein translocase subunit SecD [Thermopetrobacter sp.]|nr:protein translocase subunit SecD [Thermopetrobacter sp.]